MAEIEERDLDARAQYEHDLAYKERQNARLAERVDRLEQEVRSLKLALAAVYQHLGS